MSTQSVLQRGLSLVELLIALAISSLLILGISQIYIDNKQNYLFQQGQSDNIENARYTLLVLEEELQRTGYRTRPDDAFENAFRAGIQNGCNFQAGEVIKFDAATDTLCIRYQPNYPGVAACDGKVLSIANTPYTAVDPEVVRLQISNGDLLCNGAPLVSNLRGFRFEFGVSPPDVREVTHYTLSPSGNEVVRAVRYSALLRSRSDRLANDTESTAYKQWRSKWHSGEDDEEVGASAPDRALYLIAESTVTLRNLVR